VKITKPGAEVYSITCHGHYALLLKAIPNMFHYLNEEQIPFATDRLENYLDISKKLTLHSGYCD